LNTSPIQHRIKVEVNVLTKDKRPPRLISPQQATSLALIINELTINSIKHAFRQRDEGHINMQISLNEQDAQLVTMTYHDNGPGWPTDVLQNKRSGVGLHLIRGTVHSPLHGKLHLHNDNGAVATITFKLAQFN
jgi:two-component sensor histidine kinase